MAAIDPTAEPESVDGSKPSRATLRLIREAPGMDDDDESYDDDDESDESDDEEDSDAEEVNGGPSDPARTKKALQASLKKGAQESSDDSMEDVDGEVDIMAALSKISKGKGKALDDEDDDSEGESEDTGIDEFVLCTLDPEKVSRPRKVPLPNCNLCSVNRTTSNLSISRLVRMSACSSALLAPTQST